jgi:hypothetical protein
MSVLRIPALTRVGLGAALLTAGFGLAVFMAPTTASASEAPTISICSFGTMHAAHWKVGHKSGNTWIVSATSPTKCAFAEKTGAALTHLKVDSSGNFSKPPKGYVCAGTPYGGQPTNILCHAHYGTGSFNVSVSSS